MNRLSRILTKLSTFFSSRKGLLLIMAIVLVALNFLLRVLFHGWFAESDFLLHFGIILGFIGVMIAWAL